MQWGPSFLSMTTLSSSLFTYVMLRLWSQQELICICIMDEKY